MDKKDIRRRFDDFLDSIEEEVRKQVLDDVRGALGGEQKVGRQKTKNGNGSRDMGCIAPNCKNRSKGPRFRYLCEKHAGANDKQVQEWREARKA